MTFPWVQLRRFVASACDGPFGSAIKSDHYVDDGARVVRLGNIGLGEWRDEDAAYLDHGYWASLARHHVEPGDLLIAGLGDEGHPVGRAVVAPDAIGPALVKADCYRLRLQMLDPWFAAYYLSSSDGLAQSWQVAEGSTRPRLTLGKALSLRIPVPTLAEQRAIADYLDAETARIDALITKKRRMIDLLHDRRRALLEARVVGASFDGAARSTSVPWAPEIPSHWDDVELKLVAQLGSGHTPSRNHPEWWIEEECVIPWVTTGEVSQMRSDRLEYLTETREKISQIGMANSSACLHLRGSVVLCRTAASAGYSAMLGSDMATSQDIVVWMCGPRIRPRYLLLCLRAMRTDLLERLAMGSTHKTIYMPDIESIRVPLPPVEEQDAIVDAVWSEWRRIDQANDALSKQIELLAEHRQALITAAVTGALRVPGETA